MVLIGYGLGKSSLRTTRFPAQSRIRRLDIGYRMRLNDSREYLTVDASAFSVYAADDDSSCLCVSTTSAGNPAIRRLTSRSTGSPPRLPHGVGARLPDEAGS